MPRRESIRFRDVELVLRLKCAEGIVLGPGRAELLERIDRLGSISAAARDMGMSYRHAWKLLDLMNRLFHEPVIQASHGGRQRGQAVLTPVGRNVLDGYRQMTRKAKTAVRSEVASVRRLIVGGRGR